MDVVAMLVLVAVVGAIIFPPLFQRQRWVPAGESAAAGGAGRKAEDLLADIEFDMAMGKLADEDYAALRSRAATAAAVPPAPVPDAAEAVIDPLEAEIRAARRGRRFCTGCGTMLPKAARFCPACGTPAEGQA